jgi:hypothetical protein
VLASFGNTQRTEQVDRIDADAFCFDGDAFSGVYLGGQKCDWCSAYFGRSEAKGLYAIRCMIWPAADVTLFLSVRQFFLS